MPKSSKAKLAYQKKYNALPENVNRREENNRARAMMIKKGSAKVGDGKDVAHIVPLDKGGKTTTGNIKIESRKANRDWRKGRKGYDVGTDK